VGVETLAFNISEVIHKSARQFNKHKYVSANGGDALKLWRQSWSTRAQQSNSNGRLLLGL